MEFFGRKALASWCDGACCVAAAVLKRTAPRVGFISRAAMRSNVVFPAPFGPRSATNSPGWISSETPRNAASEPKRFSTLWNDTPRGAGADGDGVASAGNAMRLASHQVAEGFFDAGTFAGVIVFTDGAGLAAEFEAKDIVFEIVEAAADLAVNIGDCFDRAARRIRRGRRAGRRCECCGLLRGARRGFYDGARSWDVCFGNPRGVAGCRRLRPQPEVSKTENEDGDEAAGENPFQAVETRGDGGGAGGSRVGGRCIGARVHGGILRIVPAAGRRAGTSRRATAATSLRRGRHGSGSGDADFDRRVGRDVVARVNVEALVLSCRGDAGAGNLYGGRGGNDQMRAGIGRDVVQCDVIARVRNFVGEAHAAFTGTERKSDGHFIFALVDGALHYGHAGGAPRGGLIEIGAVGQGEIEGAIGAIEREGRLGFIGDHVFFADHQVCAVWLENDGVIGDAE